MPKCIARLQVVPGGRANGLGRAAAAGPLNAAAGRTSGPSVPASSTKGCCRCKIPAGPGTEKGGMERLCELGFVHTGSVLKEHFTFLKDDDISKLCDAIVQDYDSLTQPKISLSAASTAKNTPDRQVQPADSFDDSSSIGGKSAMDTHGRPYAFSS